MSKSCISHNRLFNIILLYLQKCFGQQLHNYLLSQYCHSFVDVANQDSPLWERVGMEDDLSPPLTSHNMVKALKFVLSVLPREQQTIEMNKAF